MFLEQRTDVRHAAAAVLAGPAGLGDLADRAGAGCDGGAHGRAADHAADADVHSRRPHFLRSSSSSPFALLPALREHPSGTWHHGPSSVARRLTSANTGVRRSRAATAMTGTGSSARRGRRAAPCRARDRPRRPARPASASASRGRQLPAAPSSRMRSNEPVSSPAQNPRPSPDSTTARTDGSPRSCAALAMSAVNISSGDGVERVRAVQPHVGDAVDNRGKDEGPVASRRSVQRDPGAVLGHGRTSFITRLSAPVVAYL